MKKQKLKKVELLDLNEAYQRVLNWFFSFPSIETGLNDLASDVSVSKATAKRVVEVLIKEEFLERKIYGKAWRLTSVVNHPYNFSRKIAFNLSMVYEAYNNGLRNHILNIVSNPRSVILFGSYRKGDDTEKSDIDIAVEVSDDLDIRVHELGVVPIFGYRQNVRVTLHLFSRSKVDINLFSNIANGIVLEGFLEVRV